MRYVQQRRTSSAFKVQYSCYTGKKDESEGRQEEEQDTEFYNIISHQQREISSQSILRSSWENLLSRQDSKE